MINVGYNFPRGTRTALNQLASDGLLVQGQAYLMTDEGRVAVAVSTTQYQAYAFQGEGGSSGGSDGEGWADAVKATGTGAPQILTLPESGVAVHEVLVFVNGLRYATTEYTITGNQLTLTTNASGDVIEVVRLFAGGSSTGGETGSSTMAPLQTGQFAEVGSILIPEFVLDSSGEVIMVERI